MTEFPSKINLFKAVELAGKTLKYTQICNDKSDKASATMNPIDLKIETIDLELNDTDAVVAFHGTANASDMTLRAPLKCLKSLLEGDAYRNAAFGNGDFISEYFKIVNPQVFHVELNDFVSKEDECLTTIALKDYASVNAAADAGWHIIRSLANVYDAELENQGDQFMVYRKEGTYDPAKDEAVLYTLRVLDEDGNACDLD
jgi:hypothetical protein